MDKETSKHIRTSQDNGSDCKYVSSGREITDWLSAYQPIMTAQENH